MKTQIQSKILAIAAAAMIGMTATGDSALARDGGHMGSGLTHFAACSDQIARLRQAALANHEPTPETVWQAHSYAQLMFAADLALAEADDAAGSEDECLLAARHANNELQPTSTASKN